jgi:hypothetical protein
MILKKKKLKYLNKYIPHKSKYKNLHYLENPSKVFKENKPIEKMIIINGLTII